MAEMTYGASALGRTPEGQVVFVDDALPGERVSAEVLKRKRRYLQARAVEVLQPSPARIEPPCPYVPECGGCQWQHAGYQAQLAMKQQVLEETLRRAGVSCPSATLVAAPSPLRYRIRGEFHVIPPDPATGLGHRLGFNRRRTYQTVAVDDCLIHHPHITEALDGIQHALDAAGAGLARGLRLTAHPDRRELLWHPVGGAAPAGLQAAMTEALPAWLVQQDSISLEYDRGLIDGAPGVAMFRVDSETFVQVNHEQAHNLYRLALEYLGDRPGALVEGYAGFGAMSALAGSRPDEATRPSRVTLIEENRAAATLARLHMRLHGVEVSSVLAGRLEDKLALLDPGEVDSVIIDPPRAGCAPQVIRELARLRPERIVYVSCDPATLARDLHGLAAEGFEVAAQALVDMFPQTYHLETVSLVQKRGGDGVAG